MREPMMLEKLGVNNWGKTCVDYYGCPMCEKMPETQEERKSISKYGKCPECDQPQPYGEVVSL